MSNRRRKSLSLFRPNTLSSLTPIRDGPPERAAPQKEPATLKKKLRPSTIFSSSPTNSPPSPLSASSVPETTSSPNIRPRTLQKQTRPQSIFGSFRSLHSLPDEDENLLRTECSLVEVDGDEEGGTSLDVEHMSVLHHGEVQVAGSMFRKKSQYLVLTSTHFLRFKNQAKASDVFPVIPSSLGRSTANRHSRMSSGGSNPEGYFHADAHTAIPMRNVVAAYKLDDGRPYFTIELAHYDENTNVASTMTMQLNDPRDSDIWLTSIRAAMTKFRLTEAVPFGRRAIEYCARALEMDADYDRDHFRMFTVVQRATKSGGRSSSDDLGKLMSNIFYFVIGLHKVHLIPMPKQGKSASSTSLNESTGGAYGLMCLSSVYVQSFDDAFQLGFRMPLQPQQSLHLASSSANDIALCMRQATEWLRPNWVSVPYVWNVPENLEEALLPVADSEDDYGAFDRTLIAYCVSYNVDPSVIRYTVNYTTEDAPEFDLFDPGHPRRQRYTSIEILAILRALRYNEFFHSIAFRNTKLDAIHGLYDRCGSEHFMWSTRSGAPIKLPRLDRTPLIVQELQCLALKSKRLRRLDFSNCLSRHARDINNKQDAGTGICEAIFPLCLLQYTNIDWVTLNGVVLSEVDLEYVYASSIKRVAHLRAVELARCGLDVDRMRICLEGLSHQTDTLESIVLSANPVYLSPDLLAKTFSNFTHIRNLDLSKVMVESSSEPLVGVEVLVRWKLETLNLSGTTLNAQTVDAVAGYLHTSQSSTLRELRMDQCQLTGEDVATILRSIADGRTSPQQMHLHVSENRLERSHSSLVNAIRASVTPTHLTMQMLEYSHVRSFSDLLHAVASNKSLEYLDISRTSVPYDASAANCASLRHMLETNTTLTTLNISGEQAHLEAVTLGRGLPNAILGLETNTALKALHIEHQSLGLPGASALASALESNHALTEVHCDDNEISLQAFTVLVNALTRNTTLLHLSPMVHDRAWSRSKIDREINSMMASSQPPADSSTSRTSALKKTLTGRSLSQRSADKNAQQPIPGFTPQDVRAVVDSLDGQWQREVNRLGGYLQRNYCIAEGIQFDADVEIVGSAGASRPTTAASGGLAGALAKAGEERTPTAELNRQLGGGGGGLKTPTTDLDRQLSGRTSVDENASLAMRVGPGFEGKIGGELTIEDLYVGGGLQALGLKDGMGRGGDGVDEGDENEYLTPEGQSPEKEEDEAEGGLVMKGLWRGR